MAVLGNYLFFVWNEVPSLYTYLPFQENNDASMSASIHDIIRHKERQFDDI